GSGGNNPAAYVAESLSGFAGRKVCISPHDYRCSGNLRSVFPLAFIAVAFHALTRIKKSKLLVYHELTFNDGTTILYSSVSNNEITE
ncbi:hypothetical protein, partial [Dickeya dadantii]|uniref:hypothetical protein n=1 Tax=Dickeya dadantii TaxID=204038 RepID=UPI001C131DF8